MEVGCVGVGVERVCGDCGEGEGEKGGECSDTWLLCEGCGLVGVMASSPKTNLESRGGGGGGTVGADGMTGGLWL